MSQTERLTVELDRRLSTALAGRLKPIAGQRFIREDGKVALIVQEDGTLVSVHLSSYLETAAVACANAKIDAAYGWQEGLPLPAPSA